MYSSFPLDIGLNKIIALSQEEEEKKTLKATVAIILLHFC